MYLKQSNPRRRGSPWRLRLWLLLALAYATTGLAWLGKERPLALIGAAAPTTTAYVQEAVVDDEAQRRVERGDLYFNQGNITAALESYEEAVAADPNLAVAYARWGQLLNLRYRTDEAMIRTGRAVSLAPENAEALAAHAMSLTWAKEFAGAVEHAQRAISADPEYAPAYAFLAEAYMDSQQYEDAFATAERAIEVDPDNVWAWLNHGYVYESWGQYEQAMSSYREAVAIVPLSYLYTSMGRIEWLVNQNYEGAIELFKEATYVDPRNPEPYAELANLYMGLEDPLTAQQFAQKGIEQDPTFGRNHALLGQILYSQLNFEGAIGALEQAVSYGYSSETVFTLAGLSHAYLEQCDRALPWLQRALDRNPESQPAQAGMEICQPGPPAEAPAEAPPEAPPEAPATPEGSTDG